MKLNKEVLFWMLRGLKRSRDPGCLTEPPEKRKDIGGGLYMQSYGRGLRGGAVGLKKTPFIIDFQDERVKTTTYKDGAIYELNQPDEIPRVVYACGGLVHSSEPTSAMHNVGSPFALRAGERLVWAKEPEMKIDKYEAHDFVLYDDQPAANPGKTSFTISAKSHVEARRAAMDYVKKIHPARSATMKNLYLTLAPNHEAKKEAPAKVVVTHEPAQSWRSDAYSLLRFVAESAIILSLLYVIWTGF